jgi:ATP-dependent helicase HrpB
MLPAMTDPAHGLPIDEALPALRAALAERGVAVLQAPPGAGKTTRVPLALLHEAWLGAGRILMLEPRRLAARAAAFRMADTVGEEPGGLVGYRIRHDTRVGPRTRVEVLTEGVLTRMLQADPALDGASLVIFDEFHERSVHADLGLALTLQSRAILRPELRILVMSATLDGGAVSALLDQAPIVTSEGRQHPVATRYLPTRAEVRLERAVAAAVRMAVAEEEGDVLAFLPGAGEIHRTAALLHDVPADVIPLHGTLAPALQQQALRPSPPGRRKVVLASAIAETSLTIDGVRIVVDGGWSRVPRYSPRTGMTRLATVRVTRASADQRRGRAGRQAPGICYRLWSQAEEAMLVPRPSPEILETDLAPLALDLAAAGVADPGDLQWLDPPPAAGLAAARTLLVQLGALDAGGRITAHGRRMSRLSLHPRLAHMVIQGRELGAGDLACDLAALLAERDLLARGGGEPNADIALRLELLWGRTDLADVDRESLRRARAEARMCRDRLSTRRRQTEAPISPGALLALAYPDRIARRRAGPGGRFVLRSGTGAVLDAQTLAQEEFLVAAELDGRPPDSRIRLAARLDAAELEAHFGDEIAWEDELRWDDGTRSVIARRRRRFGAIVLDDRPLRQPDPMEVTNALLEGIRREGVDRLPWGEAARRVRARLAFVHHLQPDWPNPSDEALAGELATWLGPSLTGLRRWEDLERLDLGALLLARLSWDQRASLETWAPAEILVPSGSRIPIDYADPASPVLAVRLQELFGLAQTPRVGRGQVPLTLHLLSPARRPVQVTRDLAGFWRTTYFDVRKDLKGRYPKHHWPDDPLAAEPTRRVKRHGSGGT